MNKLNYNRFNYNRSRQYVIGMRRRRRRRNNNNSRYSRYHNIPAISNKPITMGYGTTSVNITHMKTTTYDGNIQTETLKDIIYSSEEFMLKMNEFMYFRVNYVKILIFPSQPLVTAASEALGNDIPINRVNYIYFNWARNDTSITTTQLANSDNTKIISSYLARNKIYTFIPPNFTFNGLSGTVNPTAFTNTQFNDYPGYIKFLFYNIMQLRIEVNITFRGSKDMNTSALIQSLKQMEITKKEQITLDKRNKSKQKVKEEKIQLEDNKITKKNKKQEILEDTSSDKDE
jgi:hypothetical protein